MAVTEMQLGKNGLTTNFLEDLKIRFKKNESIRISVLKSAGHEKAKIKEYSKQILEELGNNYTATLIGFKIILRKWRRAMR